MKANDAEMSKQTLPDLAAGVLKQTAQNLRPLQASRIGKLYMNTFAFLLAINPTAQPALRIAFTVTLLLALGVGVLIYRRRDQLFGRDPEVVNDTPVVRHNRTEEIVVVWGGLTLAVLGILYQLWFG